MRSKRKGSVGSTGPGGACQVASVCSPDNVYAPKYVRCLKVHGVEGGFVYQSPRHYWRIQWAEAAIYLGLSLVLFAVTLVAVCRSRD